LVIVSLGRTNDCTSSGETILSQAEKKSQYTIETKVDVSLPLSTSLVILTKILKYHIPKISISKVILHKVPSIRKSTTSLFIYFSGSRKIVEH